MTRSDFHSGSGNKKHASTPVQAESHRAMTSNIFAMKPRLNMTRIDCHTVCSRPSYLFTFKHFASAHWTYACSDLHHVNIPWMRFVLGMLTTRSPSTRTKPNVCLSDWMGRSINSARSRQRGKQVDIETRRDAGRQTAQMTYHARKWYVTWCGAVTCAKKIPN
jgi:hypothetical protein